MGQFDPLLTFPNSPRMGEERRKSGHRRCGQDASSPSVLQTGSPFNNEEVRFDTFNANSDASWLSES